MEENNSKLRSFFSFFRFGGDGNYLFGKNADEPNVEATSLLKKKQWYTMPERNTQDLRYSDYVETPTQNQCYKLAVINNKGGVAKTTTAVNLAAALAVGTKVLLIDVDRQASATTALGVQPQESPENTLAGLLSGEKQLHEVIYKSPIEGLDVIPSGMGMTLAEGKFYGQAYDILMEKLQDITEYGYIVFDCSPAFTSLTCNVLLASDACIVPTTIDYFSIKGLEDFLETIRFLELPEGKVAPLLGIVLTMIDYKEAQKREKSKALLRQYGDLIFKTIIPYDSLLAQAPEQGKSIFEYAEGGKSAYHYWELSKEVAKRCRQLNSMRAYNHYS
jgi:chromosome partitioning protein